VNIAPFCCLKEKVKLSFIPTLKALNSFYFMLSFLRLASLFMPTFKPHFDFFKNYYAHFMGFREGRSLQV